MDEPLNLEKLVIQMYEAFSKRDYETLNEVCAKDIVWKQNPGFPGGGTHYGVKDIVKNVYESNNSRWKYFNFERLKISTTKDSVIVEGNYIVESYGTKRRIKVETAHIFLVHNQKIISFQQYTDTFTLWEQLK